MRNNRDFQGDNFIKKRKIHKYLRRVVALLSAFVLLFTVNTLKRNANTLERIATCGYEEHAHDAGCYDAAGALICGLEEHVHTDACYQAAPTEVEVQLGDEEEQDLPLEDDEASLEPENVFVEENPTEEPKVFSLSEPTPVSAIVEAMKLDVDLGRVIEVGAIVDDAEHEGLLDVQPMDGGDWMVSALREFDDAELALVLEDDILIVDLENKAPAQPQEAEIQAEQTEVDPEPTEEGQAIEEQTEVDTVVEEQPGEETPVEEVEADLSEVTADAPETADVEAADENPEITDEIAETSDVEAADENPEITDETAETSDVEATDENPEITDETAETSDVEAVDENPEITDETAETSDVEATDENNTETTDETAEAEPETADEPSEETSDENPETADEPSEETSDENPETTDEPSEEAGDEQDVDEAAQDGQAADAEPEETDEATEETSDETADAVEKQPDVSVTVDLSSVDLMGAASVEADTVKLNVADLLNAEDAAVERSGDLTVDTADFVDAATVVAADNVAVEDGVITLTAEAMEAGSVTMALESEDEDAEPQVVEIALSGYTGRVTDEIASDPAVQIVPAEGNSLPADAFAAVKSGDVPEELLDSEAAEDENIIQSAKAYDITITNANEDEISNTGAVEVTLTPSDLDVLVDVPETATVNKLDYELYHIHDDGTCEKVEDAVFDVAEDGTLNSVSFTTESFSTYVVKYTVDFTYVDAEGNERFWQFPGSGSHALREVLSELGIEGETITDASLELTEQVDEAGENDLYLTQDLDTQEYFINSDAPFDDTYTLTVTVDEVVYTIIVTDDQQAEQPYNPEWTVNVNLFERNGSVATTNLEALKKTTYGVMAVIYDKYEGTPLGYKIMGSQFRYGSNPVDNPEGCHNYMSFNFNLSQCNKIAQNENGAWVDGGAGFNFNSDENAWVVDADHKYASKDVDIQFELFEAEDYGGAPDYNRVSVDGWNSKSYQTAYQYARGVTGFDFKPWPNGHKVNASSHTAELNLQRAYTKTYKLRVNTAPTNVGIHHDDYLYALVRLNAGLATEKTGMFHIHFPASSKEETYEFAASEWKKTSIGSSGTNSISNLTFTGDETVEVFLFYKHNGQGNVSAGFDDIYSHCIPEITAKSEYSEYKDGDTAYGMKVSLTPIRSVVNNDAASETYIYDTINFLTLDPTGSITKSHIDSFLQDARDFGYYTLEYIGHSGDIEATIGADYMNAEFHADYGYSQRNVQTNVLKVKKVYMKDGEPNPHQSVTIKLYKTDKDGNRTGEAIETKTGETNDKGILELEFTGLEPGGYTVSEKLGSGPEIFPGSSGQVSGLTTTFSAADVRFVENGNVNYFGTIDYANSPDGDALLDRMLSKGKRVPLVILTDTQETVTRIENWVSNHSDAYGSGKVSAAVNGTSPYKHYDIPSDMERMRALSRELATATDSKTVRVVNVKASELTEEGLSFSNENRFIVVNVKMDQKAFCPMVRLDGRVLEGDFGRGGKENSTKVLFNLLNEEGTEGYGEGIDNSQQAEFDTTKTGAGVILAPWANAHELGGVFGGTIISRWVDRKGNEIHSDNPNQRQNLNITIQNEEGTPQVGMLELRKEYPENSNIKDRITYFPFKVKLYNSDMSKLVGEGKSFPASGLKEGDTVTFTQDEDRYAVADVLVRADNSVTIANLPAGTTYEVTEVLTEDLAKLYTFVGAKNNKNSGTIATGTTESVTLINDVPRSGLTLKKVVQGTDATDKDFSFELYLWHEDGDNPITAFTNDELTDKVTAKKNNVAVNDLSFISQNYDGHAAGVYAFTLKANEQLVVDGLPQGVNYAFVELTDKDHMPVGYQVVTPNGKVDNCELPRDNQATITNKYEAQGTLTLNAHKKGNTKLGEKEFAFQLTDAEGTVLSEKQAQQDQTATFDVLTFVRNKEVPEGNNKTFAVNAATTEFTFYIKEVIPTDAVARENNSITYSDEQRGNYTWVYDDVIYDSTIHEVTVIVQDDGKGNLEVVKEGSETGTYVPLEAADLTKTFTNTPVEKAKVGVKKEWSTEGPSTSTAELYLVRFKKDAPTAAPTTAAPTTAAPTTAAPTTAAPTTAAPTTAAPTTAAPTTAAPTTAAPTTAATTEAPTTPALEPTGTNSESYVVENCYNSSLVYEEGSFQAAPGSSVTLTIRFSNPDWDRPCVVKYNNVDLDVKKVKDYANSELVCSTTFEVVQGKGLRILTNQNNEGEIHSIDFTQSSAFAAPSQLAWSPFVAYADDYTTLRTADKVAEAVARSGMVAPAGYSLDTEFGRSIPVTKTETYKTVENLPVYDENGIEYYYAVVEASQLSGYTVTYGKNDEVTTTPTPVKASELICDSVEPSVTLKAINTYRYVSATPHAVKKMDGQPFMGKLNDEPVTFKFTIEQTLPEGATYKQTVETDSNGVITFPSIEYTQSGTYVYKIYEEAGNLENVSYATSTYYWRVEVTESNRVLSADAHYYSSNALNQRLDDAAHQDYVPVFNNHELTEVNVVKQWCLNGGEASDVFPFTDRTAPPVKVYLYRKATGSGDDKIIDADSGTAGDQSFTVPYNDTEKKWYLNIPGLEKYDKDGNLYEYYIVEDTDGGMQGWKPYLYKAQNASEQQPRTTVPGGASSSFTVTGGGTLTVVNSMSQVALPATGGVGTGVIYAAGAGLLALALAWWLARMRKRDYDA